MIPLNDCPFPEGEVTELSESTVLSEQGCGAGQGPVARPVFSSVIGAVHPTAGAGPVEAPSRVPGPAARAEDRQADHTDHFKRDRRKWYTWSAYRVSAGGRPLGQLGVTQRKPGWAEDVTALGGHASSGLSTFRLCGSPVEALQCCPLQLILIPTETSHFDMRATVASHSEPKAVPPPVGTCCQAVWAWRLCSYC